MSFSPMKYWQQAERFSKEAGEYDFDIYSQAKERSGRSGNSKIKTRRWESVVNQAAEEQTPRVVPVGDLGLEVLFLATEKRGDLTNMLKSLEDALNRRAYHDDSSIDYIKAMRVYGPDIPNRILVRVLEKV